MKTNNRDFLFIREMRVQFILSNFGKQVWYQLKIMFLWGTCNLRPCISRHYCTYFPSGSVSSVHSFKRLPLNFHGNLHSAFLSALSLVVRHISPEMKKFILKNPTNIQFSPNKSRNVPIGNLFSPINMNNISHKVPIISTVLINVTDLIFEIVRHVYLKTYGKF